MALLVLFGFYVVPAWKRSIAERQERRQAAIPECRELYSKLVPPAGFESIPYDSPQEHEYTRKYSAFQIEQRFEIQGKFADVVKSYQDRLTPEGWVVFDPSRVTDFWIELCHAPWMLRLQRDADFESERKPHHRLSLTLIWNDSLTSSRCPLPQMPVS